MQDTPQPTAGDHVPKKSDAARAVITLVAGFVVAAGLAVAIVALPGRSEPQAVAAGCDAAVEHRISSGGHIIGEPAFDIRYSSTPATSGWHAGGRPTLGRAAEPVSDAVNVAAVEAGAVTVLVGSDATPAQVLAAHDAARPLMNDRLPILSGQYTEPLPAGVTLSAWGVTQRCDAPTSDAIRVFHEAFAQTPGTDAH